MSQFFPNLTKYSFIFSALLLSNVASHVSLAATEASNSEASSSDFRPSSHIEEQALLNLLEQQTLIATKTKMNADFVPGMVTVLLGKQLEKNGTHTVWDALGQVAGIENLIDGLGGKQVKVRGIGGDFGVGQIKILLDNVDMTSAFFAHAQPVFAMPIEQVERIEIIRGAGSAIHGENAFTAVINVISKKTTKRLFSKIAKNNHHLVGGNYFWKFPQHQASASLNLSYSDTDGEANFAPQDSLFQTGTSIGMSQAHVSRAPGKTFEGRRYHALIYNLNWNNFELKFNWLKERQQNYFGAHNILADDNATAQGDYKTIELSHQFTQTKKLNIETKLGWRTTQHHYQYAAAPKGFQLWHYPNFPLTLNAPAIKINHYQEQEFFVSADTFIKQWKNHSILFGLSYSKTRVSESWEKSNIHPNNTISFWDDYPIDSVEKFYYNEGANVANDALTREVYSVSLQDEFQPFKALMLTAGARLDSYHDFGTNLSPRLAAVYHLNKNHIFKAQYAQAFRPPTFIEKSLSPKLKAQTNATYDFGYLFKSFKLNIAITAYYAKILDTIYYDVLNKFSNSEPIQYKGIEFEGKYKFNKQWQTTFNLSYAKTKEHITQQSLPDMANYLANFIVNYQPSSAQHYSLHYRFVGSKHREFDDPRDKLDSYHKVNINAQFKDFLSKGSQLQIGVDNLFNQDIRYAAPMVSDILGNRFPSYQNDYPRAGRSWWLRLSYQL